MENTTAVEGGAQQLVRVFTGQIGGQPMQVCDGRELHGFLRVGRDFSTWMPSRIQKFGFEVGKDYSPVLGNRSGSSCGKPRTEYHLTLDMAKELSMVENNEQGRMARRYFIDMERRALSAAVLPALPAPEQPLEKLAFDDYGIMIVRLDGQLWFSAGNLSTALRLGGSDRILRNLAPQHKQQRQHGARNLWFINLYGARSAANYCKSELADRYRTWLQRVEQEACPAVSSRPALAEALLPGHTAVERFGLDQLLDTKLLFSLDDQGKAQVKSVPADALIVSPSRLAEVLRDPFAVPVEHLPGLMQVIAGRLGAAIKPTLPGR